MATSTRLVLQPHLRERLTAVQSLLGPELRSELEAVLAQPLLAEVEAPRRASGLVAERPQAEIAPTTEKKKEDDSHSSATGVGAGRTEGDPEKAAGVEDEKQTEGEEDRPEVVPPTVDVELLDRLARWAEGKEAALRDAGLDAGEYSYIALLAGTSSYLPRAQARALRDAEQSSEKPSPYLPAHLSPNLQPSFASEYRQLTRLLSTVLNVLFSVVGCGFAAYVAATTGAAWTRESAVLLAVAVGAVVGFADTAIVFLYKRRAKEDGVRSARLRSKYSKGTGATGVLLERDADGEITKEIALGASEGATGEGEGEGEGDASLIPAPKREVRLRRRAVAEKGT